MSLHGTARLETAAAVKSYRLRSSRSLAFTIGGRPRSRAPILDFGSEGHWTENLK
jgi:hypothetical protein